MSMKMPGLIFPASAVITGAACVFALSVTNAQVTPPETNQGAKNAVKSEAQASRSQASGPMTQAVKPGGNQAANAGRSRSSATAAVQAVKRGGNQANTASRSRSTATAAVQAVKPSGNQSNNASRSRSSATAAVQAWWQPGEYGE
jgi:hypothetical protein